MAELKEVLSDIEHCKLDKVNAKLLAVSKMQSVESIQKLYTLGQRLFGENYVQEALPKMQQLNGKNIEWHFIGSLQRNKVKSVIGLFSLIHSVDSVDLLKKIDLEAGKKKLKQNILLSVNLAGEATKSGFSESEVLKILPEIRAFANVQICGLMTMPPLFDDAELSRPYFKKLRELSEQIQQRGSSLMSAPLELSMGTSHDYKVALSEGATIVRLGTMLFGERRKIG